MDVSKEELLNYTHQKFMEVCLSDHLPLDILGEILDEDAMGFGTTVDEKIFSISGLRELIHRQREQTKGLTIRWNITPVMHRLASDGNSAVFADDISLSIIVNNETVEMNIRCSVALEFQKYKWWVVHWHSSKPENVESEKDTFGIEDWKQKNAELEKIVAERTVELTKQKEALEHTLQELHSTQAQLIQSEKMASLGELTAGIAHEIQNPLNFVNNFSEVNKELLAEMKDELDKGNLEDAKAIANDVIENEEKIYHHGKRADSIVKGMLQHSHSNSGTKEPTDINNLADEYLRLSYHGLRAKDKSFNATIKTDYDESIGKVNIVAQDIGRVLLNLINNAFYAVAEKKKLPPSPNGGQNADSNEFEPTVSVNTKNIGDKVEISVKDNGNGIPQKILDKIFQPFFTTKPTGQGTGLGLSLAYDIVKAHGGVLSVETQEGEGAEFVVELPF